MISPKPPIDNIAPIRYNYQEDNNSDRSIMKTTVGIRDLARNSKILEQYDYVDVIDKRTYIYKGLFVSPKYAEEFKAYLARKIEIEKRKSLDDIMQFAGISDKQFGDNSVQKLTAMKRKKYEE